MKLKLLLIGFLCPSALRSSADQTFHGKGLTVTLVSEVSAVQPGVPFYTGLFIHHDAGYHTYWKNPGLAGVATRLEWTLPAGFTAGEMEWPAPEKLKMAQINTHGYNRDVVLMVKITPPATLTGDTAAFAARAAWMCCAQICNPGLCDLKLALPVQRGGGMPEWDASWRPEFLKHRAAVPGKATGWNFTARRDGKEILLTGEPAAQESSVPRQPQFFSSDNLICSHPAQHWERTAKGFRCRLPLSDFPPKESSALRGLLHGKGGWLPKGAGEYVEISVPLSR